MKKVNFVKTLIALIITVCLLIGMLPAALADEATPLKFLCIGGKEAGFDAAITRWNELHPEAPVTPEYYAMGPLFEVIEAALGIGSTDYDILAVDSPKVGDYGHKGFTMNLDEYIGSVIDPAVFQAPALNGCYYNNHLTCLPLTAGISFLYYNKTLLDEAGVELREITPESRLTFEEMEKISLQVLDAMDPNRDQGYSGIAFSQPNVIYQMLQLPTSMGASGLVDDQDLASTLHTDGWRNAALYYQKLIDEKVTDPCLDTTLNVEKFFGGKAVFMLCSISAVSTMRKMENLDLRVTYNPVFEEYGIAAAPTGSWCVGVSAFTKNPALSTEFVNFVCAGEGHVVYTEALNSFSALQADADALLADPEGDYVMKIGTYEAANVAVPRPVTPNYSTYETVMNEFWRNIASGADVDQAIETAIETYSIYIQ